MKKLFFFFATFVLLNTNSFSQGCLPGGITFNNQQEIDNFQTNYPGCSYIEGDVEISGEDISNLIGLAALDSIMGDLIIIQTSLNTLSGLENLKVVYGNFHIRYCYSLNDISSLINLTRIHGEFLIGGPNSGFENSIISLTGLENLQSVGYRMLIGASPFLTNLVGLTNLTTVGGFTILANSMLVNFEGIESLISIGNDLSIGHGPMGSGMNPSLVSLEGLNGLQTIGGNLDIVRNPLLIHLNGLQNLNSIGGSLFIESNNSLQTLDGLDNIIAESIEYIDIENNESLTTCHIQSMCDYIAGQFGDIFINNNANGCNSQQEVEDACEAASVNEIKFKNQIVIYPNPATNEFFIESNNGVNITDVFIYNTVGQIVLRDNTLSSKIDISSLHRGLYFVELVSNEMKIREKLIVK